MLIAAWRERYGHVPVIAGTFTPAKMYTTASAPYYDYLRYRFGGAQLYGPLPDKLPSEHYAFFTANSPPPALNATRVALADSMYAHTAADGAARLRLAPVGSDPASPAHFSVAGYLELGRRYFAAWRTVTPDVGPPAASAAGAPPSPPLPPPGPPPAGSFACARPGLDCVALGHLYASTGGAGWAHNWGWWQAASGTPVEFCDLQNALYCDGHGRIYALRLTGNSLRGSVPASLGQLTGLLHLSLSDNALGGSLPPELASLTRLVQSGLYLRGSGLCGRCAGGSYPCAHYPFAFEPADGPLPACTRQTA